jgi:hypothetical protein
LLCFGWNLFKKKEEITVQFLIYSYGSADRFEQPVGHLTAPHKEDILEYLKMKLSWQKGEEGDKHLTWPSASGRTTLCPAWTA